MADLSQALGSQAAKKGLQRLAELSHAPKKVLQRLAELSQALGSQAANKGLQRLAELSHAANKVLQRLAGLQHVPWRTRLTTRTSPKTHILIASQKTSFQPLAELQHS